jgi:Kae1-associated kinase Bud32
MSTSLGAQPKLIYKGAEAEIYLQDWHGNLAVRKSRIPKPYRVEQLDDDIRRSRTIHEASMIHELKKLGVPVPGLLHVDPASCTIVMEHIDAETLKQQLGRASMSEKASWCNALGKIVADMHNGGVVHGDMTLSNVLRENSRLCVIDFGLSNFSVEYEDRGVDLLLFNRALKSSHYRDHKSLFNSFLKGYSTELDVRSVEIVKKMHDIERRGRYFDRG